MTRLDILVDRAANHAPLRKLIGLKSPQTRRIKNINPVEDIASRALRVEERLRNTDSSEIVGLLERSGEPVLVLIEVATHLGLRTRKKERKVELINRIEAHITNQRGYDILRGADPHADGNEALPAAVG